jgi:hypothetical protein
VNDNVAREEHTLLHLDVAGDQRGVADDDVVADTTVMRNVAIHHQEAVFADRRGAAFFRGPMDRGVLAKHGSIADDYAAGRAIEGEVLRFVTDDSAVMNLAIRADGRMTGYDCVGEDSRI